MRADFSGGLKSTMAQAASRPVLLAEFAFAAGTVYIASRDIVVGTQFYPGLIIDWAPGTRMDAGGLFDIPVMSTKLKINDTGSTPFSNHFISNVPQNTLVKLYLWEEGAGLGSSDRAEIARYYVEQPEWDGLTCEMLLVSELYRANKPIGTKLDLVAHPGADPKAAGEVINIIYGSNKNVKCLNSVAGGAAILKTDLAISGMYFTVTTPPNAKPFPAAPFTVKIKYEQIRISAYNVSTGVMTVAGSGRGYAGTAVNAHDAGRVLWEVLPAYEYLISDHPLKAIGDVYVRGVRIATGVTKTLSPVGKITIADNFTLDTSVNINSLGDGLIHGSSYKTIRLFGNIHLVGYGLGGYVSNVPSTTPTLGKIKAITVNVSAYSRASVLVSATDFSITSGPGFTIKQSGLTLSPGNNSLSFSATDIIQATAWPDLHVLLYTINQEFMINEVSFDITYDATKAPGITSASFSGNIGTITPVGLAVSVPDDIETLGNVVGMSVQVTVKNTTSPDVGPPNSMTCADASGYAPIPSVQTYINANSVARLTYAPDRFSPATPWSSLMKIRLYGPTAQLVLLDATWTIYYQDADRFRPSGAEMDGLTSASIEIGRHITCDVDGYPDSASGTYTGSANSLITNPADVIRHFAAVRVGLTPDATRFLAARSAYAAKGYEFAGVIDDYSFALNILSKMMFQSRSMIWDGLGAVKILVLPDMTALPAAARGLAAADVLRDWESRVPEVKSQPVGKESVINKIALHYGRQGEKYYGFLPESSDATSTRDFGPCERPEYYKCDFINDLDTAASLQAFVLARYSGVAGAVVPLSSPLKNLDLEPGDFITLDSMNTTTAVKLLVTGCSLAPAAAIKGSGMKSLEKVLIEAVAMSALKTKAVFKPTPQAPPPVIVPATFDAVPNVDNLSNVDSLT